MRIKFTKQFLKAKLLKPHTASMLAKTVLSLLMGTAWFMLPAEAAEKSCSIQIRYEEDGNAVAGAVFQLFHIGNILQQTLPAGDLNFGRKSSAFVQLQFESLVPGLDLSPLGQEEGIGSLAAAQEMAEICESAVLSSLRSETEETGEEETGYEGLGYEGATDAFGILRVTDVLPGLYLVREVTPAEGYRASVPFLVSVPVMNSGEWSYTAYAEPKPAKAEEPETGEETENSSTDEKTDENENPDKTADAGDTPKENRVKNEKPVKTADPTEWKLYFLLAVLSAGILLSAVFYSKLLNKKEIGEE